MEELRRKEMAAVRCRQRAALAARQARLYWVGAVFVAALAIAAAMAVIWHFGPWPYIAAMGPLLLYRVVRVLWGERYKRLCSFAHWRGSAEEVMDVSLSLQVLQCLERWLEEEED